MPCWFCIVLVFKSNWCVVPSWMLWRNQSVFSSTLSTSSTKLVIEAKKDIKFIWQGLFSINPCWWAWIIFPLLAAPLFYLGSMSAWQAYNYLGRLLYPFKILAQHKLSVSPVEIPHCSMSYGKLTFIVRGAEAKAAQGNMGLSSCSPSPAMLKRCPPDSLASS